MARPPAAESREAPALARWYASLGVLLAMLGHGAFAAPETPQDASRRIVVFFRYDAPGAAVKDCAAVSPVERTLPATRKVATAALQQLFQGPTPAEREHGYHSLFSPATAHLLKGIRIRRGTAYVNLADLRQDLSVATSSCGASEFHAQVSRTLFQFPTVKRVIYAIDSNPRRFYEWLGEPCDRANGYCDARPFSP